MSVDRSIANLEGEVALPRKNGELVFGAPWEGRIFGMAVTLNDKGAYPWEDFRAALADRIAAAPEAYYERWLEAFEAVILAQGLVTGEELTGRAAEYRSLARDPVF